MIIQDDHHSCVPVSFINLAKLYGLPLTKKEHLQWLKEVLSCEEDGTNWDNIVSPFRNIFKDIFKISNIKWNLTFDTFQREIRKHKTALLFYNLDNDPSDGVHCALVYYNNNMFEIYNKLQGRKYKAKSLLSRNQMKSLFKRSSSFHYLPNNVPACCYITLNERTKYKE